MTLLSSLMLATALVAAPAEDKALDGDLAKLQGEWVTMIGPLKTFPITMRFDKGKVAIKGSFNGEAFSISGDVTTNEKAEPKALDILKLNGADGDEVKDILAIYKLEGDRLTLCSGGPGNDRPTEFKAGEAGHPILSVFTRKKADDKPNDASAADLKAVQGTWKALDGPNKDKPILVTFKDNKVEAKITTENGDNVEIKGEAKLDAVANPKTVDFTRFKNQNGGDLGDNLGLYSLDGDSLKICVGGAGNPRPTEFKGGDGGDGPRLWTFTRQK